MPHGIRSRAARKLAPDAITATLKDFQSDLGGRPEKVLERLATTEKSTIVIERQPDSKMRVTSGSWDGEKVFLRDRGRPAYRDVKS
jgi:hypothetical protein